MKKSMKILAPIAAVAVITALIIALNGNKEEIKETRDLTNRMLTQEDGYDDSFYQGQDTEKVYVNIGRDTYDLTDCIVKWSFGLPVINLNKAAEKMGLEVTERYKDEVKVSSYEIYAPEEVIDLSERTSIFLLGENGTYVKYTATSGLVESGDSISTPSQIASSYHVEKDENGDYLVSVSALPYADEDNNIYSSGLYSVKYDDELMTVTLKK